MDWRGPAIIAILPILVGCSTTQTKRKAVTLLMGSGSDGRCIATVEGKSFDPTDQAALEAALSSYEDQNVTFRVNGSTDVPYRCIGGAVYTLQRSGHSKIGFISEPEPKDQAAEH